MANLTFSNAQYCHTHLQGGALAIGNFDGVHRGHQALLAATRDWAKSKKTACGVLTFSPHPAQVLAKELAPKSIFTDDEKICLLKKENIDVIILQNFTLEFANLSPIEFIQKILIEQLKIGLVVVGEDFSFGKKGAGKVSFLRDELKKHNVGLQVIAPVREENLICSSTKIREFIRSGNMPAAARILGHPYFVRGKVVPGDQRGRTIGFPTANIENDRDLLPEMGVYATFSVLDDGRKIPSVTNIGLRPTFDGVGIRIEAHLLAPLSISTLSKENQFNEDLYQQELSLEFVEKIRPEIRFKGKDELILQIQQDVLKAQTLLAAYAQNSKNMSARAKIKPIK